MLPVATVVREAVDRLLADATDRRAACDRLLAAPPMQVAEWPEMKREVVEAAGRE